jgi:hypothetical protein
MGIYHKQYLGKNLKGNMHSPFQRTILALTRRERERERERTTTNYKISW